MSELSDKSNAAAKLEAAKRRAEKLRRLQEEAALELAEAESLEEAESGKAAELEAIKTQRAKEALHRAAEKRRLLKQKQASAAATTAGAVKASSGVAAESDDDEYDEYDDGVELGEHVEEPLDEVQAETGKRRQRLGLHCFNCNRTEGHYLLCYRRLLYSYLVGLTFGLAIVVGPYRCQCCGSSRLMMSNLLNPKYYLSLTKLRSKDRSRSRSSRR